LKKLITILFVIAAVWTGAAKTTDVIPPAPNPPRLVNDFAGILTPEQIQEKEDLLVAFNDSTTNVICVVTVNDLGNYTPAEFAYEIGDRWGVRSEDKRNGVVLLLKPRNETSGEVYISVGYDLEGAIPDITAGKIIDRKMMPALREGDYNAAIDSALAYILPLAAGEISAQRLDDEDDDSLEVLIGLIFIIVLVIVIVHFSKKHPNGTGGSYYGGGYFPPTHYGGNWSDYGGSFGGGSFSGGGFGGFGGGSGFGGGGAGRSF
jgi:uncharacterized protein